MIDKFKNTLKSAGEKIKEQAGNLGEVLKEQAGNIGDTLKEQAGNLTEAARQKTQEIFEDWLNIYPTLQDYGFKVTSFGFAVGISPSLDTELQADFFSYSPERMAAILEEVKGNKPVTTVMRAVKTALEWHKKSGAAPANIILIKLSICITPEVRVYIGEPIAN